MSSASIKLPGSGAITWKSSVANAAALPSSNNITGDARVARDLGFIHVWNGSSWINNGGSGTVTSVALTAPNILSVAGSPITGAGTLALTLATQSANTVFAGPTTGSAAVPTFRSLVTADLPSSAVLSVPKKNQIYIELSGNDGTATLGDESRPAATLAGAYAAIVAQGSPVSGTNQYVVMWGHGEWSMSSFELRPFIHHVGFYGLGDTASFVSIADRMPPTIIKSSGASSEFSLNAAFNVADVFNVSFQGMYFQSFQATGTSLDFGVLSNQPTINFFIKDCYFTGGGFGITIKQNSNSMVVMDSVGTGQTSGVQGGSFVLKGQSTGPWTASTANGFDATCYLSEMLSGSISVTQTGVLNLTVFLSDKVTASYSATVNSGAHYTITPQSGVYTPSTSYPDATGLSLTPYGAVTNYNDAVGALGQVAGGLFRQFGSASSPISIDATGFNTEGANYSNSAAWQTIYVQGSTANALTTITTTPAIGSSSVAGQRITIIGTSPTRPITITASGNNKLNGSMIIGLGDSLTLESDSSGIWNELFRVKGQGSLPGSRVLTATTTDGFISEQNLVGDSGGEGTPLGVWTNTGGTLSTNSTAGNVGRGARSMSWDASANGQILATNAVTIPNHMAGQKCVASMRYLGGSSLLNYDVYDGSVIIASFNGGAAVTLGTAATFTLVQTGFTMPASGTISFRVKATGNAPIVYMDDIRIRLLTETDGLLTGYVSGSGTVATTDTILQAINKLNGNDALKAPLASPTLTGVPLAPTAAPGTNTTQIATTAYADAIAALKANIASPTFTGDVNSSTGNVLVSTIGKGLQVKTGTNAKIGQATLVAGTVVVANTSVTANSRIFFSVSTAGGIQGALSYTKNAGTDFTINSTSAAETSTVDWYIIESIP